MAPPRQNLATLCNAPLTDRPAPPLPPEGHGPPPAELSPLSAWARAHAPNQRPGTPAGKSKRMRPHGERQVAEGFTSRFGDPDPLRSQEPPHPGLGAGNHHRTRPCPESNCSWTLDHGLVVAPVQQDSLSSHTSRNTPSLASSRQPRPRCLLITRAPTTPSGGRPPRAPAPRIRTRLPRPARRYTTRSPFHTTPRHNPRPRTPPTQSPRREQSP